MFKRPMMALGLAAATALTLALPAHANTTVQRLLASSTTPAPSAGRSAAEFPGRLPSLTASQAATVFGATARAYGALAHPFTTKRATAYGTSAPSASYPFSASGKLWMRFGTSSWFVCSATMIRKGIAVTAAHCVHNYGQRDNGYPNRVIFQPARYGVGLPFGWYEASAIRIPTVYWNGTDGCQVSGVVCENDVAVITLRPKANVWPGTRTGVLGYTSSTSMFTSFRGMSATQITQLGYPVSLDGGNIMQRTDSLGYKQAPNNIIIGSDMTGGSSGGPWVTNFGISGVASGNIAPTANTSNIIVGTTSWGYVATNQEVQGASLFGRNSRFTTVANIDKLVIDACASTPTAC
jgi:V8-like Glu-specific endopeptidase